MFPPPRHYLYRALLVIVVAVLSALTCARIRYSDAGENRKESCRWTVLTITRLAPDEERFDEGSDIAWPPENTGIVPGPDSLVVLEIADSGHRPHVYLKDLKTGMVRPLLPGVASGSRWSPDGKYIACTKWKSLQRPWDIVVVEVGSGKIIEPCVEWSTTALKWSPDSKSVAGKGVRYDGRGSVLYMVRMPEGEVAVLDTVDIISDYEFSWSRDSEWLVFSRPERILQYGDVVEADLWIVSRSDKMKCKLLDTPSWIEHQPLWVKPNAIQVVRTYWDGTSFGRRETVIIELKHDVTHDTLRH